MALRLILDAIAVAASGFAVQVALYFAHYLPQFVQYPGLVMTLTGGVYVLGLLAALLNRGQFNPGLWLAGALAAAAGGLKTTRLQTSGNECTAMTTRCFSKARSSLFMISIRVVDAIVSARGASVCLDANERLGLQLLATRQLKRQERATQQRLRRSDAPVVSARNAVYSRGSYAAEPGCAARIACMTFAVIGSQYIAG